MLTIAAIGYSCLSIIAAYRLEQKLFPSIGYSSQHLEKTLRALYLMQCLLPQHQIGIYP